MSSCRITGIFWFGLSRMATSRDSCIGWPPRTADVGMSLTISAEKAPCIRAASRPFLFKTGFICCRYGATSSEIPCGRTLSDARRIGVGRVSRVHATRMDFSVLVRSCCQLTGPKSSTCLRQRRRSKPSDWQRIASASLANPSGRGTWPGALVAQIDVEEDPRRHADVCSRYWDDLRKA